MDSRLAYLRLVATNGIGAISAKKLLTHFGNILALFEAGANAVAETSVIPLSKVEELFSKENLKTAEDTLLFCQKNSIQILVFEDTRYPPLLKEIDSPPPVLFVKGDTSVLSTPQIAIVGTRKPTRYGMRVAEEFAYNLSALGLVVTSGLALGTDTA
ncbi:MAG: DNA-processing protein DprA, partial [Planctomycetota bacterium]|nr:DNA-processing protein DprA [Planctomycetota bacterium]